MTRQQKYPDTATFHYHNANPKGRFTTDCVVRAISAATETPYNVVVGELAKMQQSTGFDASSPECFGRYLEIVHGWNKHNQPRKSDGKKYTGSEFCREFAKGKKIVANLGGGHTVAIIDGRVYDTWDSTDGCIGNYWTK